MAGIRHLLRAPETGLVERLVGRSVAQRRPFAAAALQYDSDDGCSEELGRRWASPREEEAAAETVRGVQWVLIGDPGVQKHVYAARLSRLLQVPHISMGSLVRQELNPRSSLYKQIANAVNEGRLVPEDVIFGLLSKRLEEGYYRGETGFILDGIPRTRIQAEILDQIADVDLVVNLKCEGECFLKNNIGSGVCSHCGQAFGANMSSEMCIAHRQLKSTPSNVHALKEKLRVYAEQGKPLEDYYKKKGKLLNFQVAGGLGETWQGLLAALHLQHIAAFTCSQKLTA